MMDAKELTTAYNNLMRTNTTTVNRQSYEDDVELLHKHALEQEPCDDCVSRQAVLEIFGYVMNYWKEHAVDVEPHEIEDALIEQYEFTAKQLSELPPVTPVEKPKTESRVEE